MVGTTTKTTHDKLIISSGKVISVTFFNPLVKE